MSEQLLVWNGVVARVPALVIRATSPRDVAEAIAFARDYGLLVRVAPGPGAERAVTLCLPRTLSRPPPPPSGRPRPRGGGAAGEPR